MTLSLNSLTGIRPFGGKMLYGYVTNDTKNTIEGVGYFNNASGYLQAGDIITVAGDLDGTPFHTSYVVASVTAGVVTLTEHSAVTQNVLHVLQGAPISSKASDAAVQRFVAPCAGTLTKIWSVLNGALATGNATITAAINGNAVTNGVVTATQAGSAAGDVDSATPTAANTVAAGDLITLTVGGSSTATATANTAIEITPA